MSIHGQQVLKALEVGNKELVDYRAICGRRSAKDMLEDFRGICHLTGMSDLDGTRGKDDEYLRSPFGANETPSFYGL